MTHSLIVNDVTQLNPVEVWAIATPRSVAEVQEALRRAQGPVSIGGGHFSMGGQTASPGSLHLDMRQLNQVLSFSPPEKIIRVQAGIRWCDIQKFIDPHNLSVKIMQTYANFTVGGSLSVNVHGRYIGLGPLILSVREIRLVLASGEIIDANPQHNADIFYGSIGGYGALGVIVEAVLELAENTLVERVDEKLPASAYPVYFRQKVRDTGQSIFHNADLYAPHYRSVRAVTWVQTRKQATTPHRLQPHRKRFPLETYFLWAITETPLGKWRREYFIDPLLYLRQKVHWRNYEAGYDAAELEPPSRKHRTYVLQEYFVPVERFNEFVPRMAEIFQRHRVNVLNVSVRHAFADPGSLLAWARGETFAFVVYYKQRTRRNARDRVAVWTRELIEASISCGGTYYLPYQPHATIGQFHRAYPRAHELFALKRQYDPECRFRNALWDKYYAPTLQTSGTQDVNIPQSEFHAIYCDDEWADKFYRFLQNVYRLYPEDRFHSLIREACKQHEDDESIYRYLQHHLPSIKPLLGDLTYALPALAKQKREMCRQTLQLLGKTREIDGYIEIGTTGRYISELRKHVKFRGALVLVNDVAPSNSLPDIVERGQFGKPGRFVPLDHYAPLSASIADNSVQLVTCYIGLHHIPLDRLTAFIRSIHRVLKPGGMFILRDHDVTTLRMDRLVALAHTVFNAGLGAPWEANKNELRFFAPVAVWSRRLAEAGLIDCGPRLTQTHDPTDNVLMAFTKAGGEA
jgi:FAD/FMN-containing dehydrogenase/SAM-dependent methyltransferase